MTPRYLPPDAPDDMEQPPPQHRDAKYRVNAVRCIATVRSTGKRCRRLATGLANGKTGAYCQAHMPTHRYSRKRKQEAMDALAARDMLEVAKIARENAQVGLMEATEIGVKSLRQLATGKDEDGEPVPKHVRVKASELLVRLGGASLEKTQVEHSGKVEHTHTITSAQIVRARLDRYSSNEAEVVEAEVIEE